MRVLVFTGYCQKVTPVASQRSTQRASMEEVLSSGVLLNPRKIILHIGIGVREAVGKELLVIVMIKSMLKTQSKEILQQLGTAILLEAILKIVNALSNSVPSCTLRLLDLVAVAQYLHSVVVKGIGFGQVYNIDTYFHALGSVAHAEEVPLRVTVGVYVIGKDEVVLGVADLDGCQKISRLESALKD